MRHLIAAVAALVLWAAPAAAQTFPKFTGLVVDAANALSPKTEAALTQKLEALQKDTRRQLVVATIPDTQGYPLEDYGFRLGRAWGVGLKEADNGAILFVVPGNPAGQRGPRLEVGRGLEPILTDAFAEQLTEMQLTPMLRANGDVDAAMRAGADAIVAQLRASPEEAKAKVDAAAREFDRQHRRGGSGDSEGFPVALIVMGVMFAFFVLPLFRRRERAGPWTRRYKHRRRGDGFDAGDAAILMWGIGNALGGSSRDSGGWGGGGGWGGSDGSWGGGGFTGGGGGDFGGGGASGSW